jgi:hypothetical protein
LYAVPPAADLAGGAKLRYRGREEAAMRTLTRIVVTLAVVVCALAWSTAWAQQQTAEKPAVEASKAWLELVDGGRYAESWDAASTLFRGAVTQENWVKLMEGNRKPLGKLVSRTFGTSKYMTSVPGGPDGKYVVVQYKTVFENKAQAIETVTPMLDKDGTWRVSGYYIK